MKSASDKYAFFRQSGWMVLATVASGVFMSAVHVVVTKPMLVTEYAVFFTLLRVFLLMGFPAGGLQVVFAQQAAAAITLQEERKLSAATRAVLRATFGIWLIMAAGVFLAQKQILALWEITNPAALWVTVLLGLASLWAPIFKGILQGRQNFAGLGWVLILDGVGRFTAIALIVHFGGQAAGGMTGAFLGQLVSFVLGAWLIREVLKRPGADFAWAPWLKQVVPLTFGVGVVLFMSIADVIFVQSVFSKNESPFYAPAAMIGLALVTFTTPLAAVMFPKIVQSAARTEKTDALRNALVATTLLGGAAALACTLLPALPLHIIYFRNPIYWKSAPIVPWFAWALLPLILANVLVSNLLARGRFRIVPWLVLVALGYSFTLSSLRDRLVLFSASDIINPAALAQKLNDHAEPVSRSLWDTLSPPLRERLERKTAPAADLKSVLAQELNKTVKGISMFNPARFAKVEVSPAAQTLLQETPQGKDLVRLNRLLLQDAFPGELVSSETKLFRGFKAVIGTLGIFSTLLLGVALWFTFLDRTAHPRTTNDFTRSTTAPPA